MLGRIISLALHFSVVVGPVAVKQTEKRAFLKTSPSTHSE